MNSLTFIFQYRPENLSPEALAEKQFLESARAEVYNSHAPKLITAEDIFKYVIEDQFLKKIEQLDNINDSYPLNASAYSFPLLDTTDLSGADLERVGIDNFDSFKAYLHFMALKLAKMMVTDRAHSLYLKRKFERGECYYDEEPPKLLYKPCSMPPLKFAHKALLQLAHMGDEKKMTNEERRIYERDYKPLVDNPKAYQKLLDSELEVVRVALKSLFRYMMIELAYKFLLPPTLHIGKIDTGYMDHYIPTEDF